MDNEEHLRGLLMQSEYLRAQMGELGKQSQFIETAIIELDTTARALDSIKAQKPGTEIMVPFGAGTYVRACLKEVETVVVGIGGDMSVERKVPDAVVTLQERRKHLAESHKSVQKALGEMAVRLSGLSREAEHLLGKSQENV